MKVKGRIVLDYVISSTLYVQFLWAVQFASSLCELEIQETNFLGDTEKHVTDPIAIALRNWPFPSTRNNEEGQKTVIIRNYSQPVSIGLV
jgi:hypothetical protein